jgi:hypothetical protein
MQTDVYELHGQRILDFPPKGRFCVPGKMQTI